MKNVVAANAKIANVMTKSVAKSKKSKIYIFAKALADRSD
jgi:hypothetical protein